MSIYTLGLKKIRPILFYNPSLHVLHLCYMYSIQFYIIYIIYTCIQVLIKQMCKCKNISFFVYVLMHNYVCEAKVLLISL